MKVPGALYQTVTMHNSATATGNGTALTMFAPSNGVFSLVCIQVTGISGDTITWEATINGSTWVAVPFTNLNTGTAATTATTDGLYRFTATGLQAVRAKISTYGSGTIIATGVAVA